MTTPITLDTAPIIKRIGATLEKHRNVANRLTRRAWASAHRKGDTQELNRLLRFIGII